MTLRPIFFLDTTPSTNLEAKNRALARCPHGTLIWAGAQSAGYGKYGRPWISEAGNLFMSLVLRPQKSLDEAAQITFLASLAVGAFLEEVLPKSASFGYKWPNDFLVDYAKIGGVLLESDVTEGEEHPFVVVGIGLNLKHYPQDLPYKATSLAAYDVHVNAEQAMTAILKNFDALYALWEAEGFAPIKHRFEEKALGLNQTSVMIFDDHHEPQRQTRICGLDTRGGLIIEDQSGIKTLYAGDIFFKQQKVN